MTPLVPAIETSRGSTRAAVLPALVRMVARAGFTGDQRARFWSVFELLTRESLDFDPSHAERRFSGICRDGTPWQFCATLSTSPALGVRYLTEIGSPSASLGVRTALAVERIVDALEAIGAGGNREIVQMLAGLTPPDDDHIAGFWVGFAMDSKASPRLRVYANNGWGDPTARWLRLIDALRALNAGGFGAHLQRLLPLLQDGFSPAGLAVTLPSSPALCKLYLRPIASPWAGARAIAREILGSGADGFVAGIEDGFEQRLETLPDRSFLLSVAGPAVGGPIDVKFDVCGHCVFEDDDRPERVFRRLARSFGLDRSAYDMMARDLCGPVEKVPHQMVAFVGVGGTAAGKHRLNVNLTAPASVTPRYAL